MQLHKIQTYYLWLFQTYKHDFGNLRDQLL